MRIITGALSLLLAASPLWAEEVLRSPSDTGNRRDIRIVGPQVTGTPLTATPAPLADQKLGDTPSSVPNGVAVSGAMAEVAARQMRRNLASIDACAASARKRSPQETGTITLAVKVVARKVAEVNVADPPAGGSVPPTIRLRDPELEGCLVKAAKTWTFSVASLTFLWPVTVSPTASR